jgi:hypothetical protein
MPCDRIVGNALRCDPAYRVGYDHGHLDGRAEAARDIEGSQRAKDLLLREWSLQRAEITRLTARVALADKQIGMLLRMQCDTEAAPGWMERFRDACARMFAFGK